MSDTNVVILIGRLVRDAETPGGERGPVRLSLAVNRRVKKGEEWTEEASFLDIEYWHRSLLPYLLKGKQIAIEGELRQERWQQDGQNRQKVVVVAQNLQLLGGGSGNGNGGTLDINGATAAQAKAAKDDLRAAADDGFTDDIPF